MHVAAGPLLINEQLAALFIYNLQYSLNFESSKIKILWDNALIILRDVQPQYNAGCAKQLAWSNLCNLA